MSDQYDFVIAGAGSAGCVLASRLTEDANCRVLLIEVGDDMPPGSEHAHVRDPYPIALYNPKFSSPGLVASVGADPGDGRPRFSRVYLQGRGVGGGSNILGMVALRGQPSDYDEWRDLGATGWGWKDCLPYFNKLEHDLDFSGPLHGADGPIPVRRIPRAEAAPFSKAFADALLDKGYSYVDDLNADFSSGVGPIPMSNFPDRRVSTAMAYLNAEVRRRKNLTILANAPVDRVEIADGVARGVWVAGPGAPRLLTGREIILSAGALRSPAILMRSGIGRAEQLNALGIEVVCELQGVGQHLMNHPEVTIATYLTHDGVQAPGQRGWGQNCLRFSSGVPGCPDNDMLLVSVNKGGWHRIGRRVAALGLSVYKSFSNGEVRLKSTDPLDEPIVDFQLASDPRDFDRLVKGLRLALEVMADRRVAKRRHEVFLPSGRIVGMLGMQTRWNAVRAAVIASIFNLAGPLRRMLLGKLVLDPAALIGDEQALERIVRARAQPVHHVCGTTRMGRADDPTAVVDPDCRVIGLQGLRVIDNSIMPAMVRANTHFPAMMIAEKMAASLQGKQ